MPEFELDCCCPRCGSTKVMRRDCPEHGIFYLECLNCGKDEFFFDDEWVDEENANT